MKISEHFNLERTQHELDFVDIDTTRDTRLFVDPYFLATRIDSFSVQASLTLRSFFAQFVYLVRENRHTDAKALFFHLNEPNETCLGMSTGVPAGRGIGDDDAHRIYESLIQSRAIETGIVEHLEDCRLFVDGIDKDKTSDMTTNIIRRHLIEYTQAQCTLWEIPLQPDVPSGFFWRRDTRDWDNVLTRMLVINESPVLLVPKAITSYVKKYTAARYRQHYVLNFLQHKHLRLNSALVQRIERKDGTERLYVTKKSIVEHEGGLPKHRLAEFTRNHPDVFREFKQKEATGYDSLKNRDIDEEDLSEICDHLLHQLDNTQPGSASATAYHRLVVAILELVFYPRLMAPTIEQEIHDGRKRIDLVFDNAATTGFFHSLHDISQIPSQYIFVECKNYSRDVANPELDQICGRFSPNRGRFGIVACREIDNMEMFLARCSDTYSDDRGLVVPLVDADMRSLIEEVRIHSGTPGERLLNERKRAVALR